MCQELLPVAKRDMIYCLICVESRHICCHICCVLRRGTWYIDSYVSRMVASRGDRCLYWLICVNSRLHSYVSRVVASCGFNITCLFDNITCLFDLLMMKAMIYHGNWWEATYYACRLPHQFYVASQPWYMWHLISSMWHLYVASQPWSMWHLYVASLCGISAMIYVMRCNWWDATYISSVLCGISAMIYVASHICGISAMIYVASHQLPHRSWLRCHIELMR